MIPVSLTLENFKSYRKGVPTLHLAGVHIACLSGSNGHGKTSLLDAMTWALWGSAIHNRQEELVHTGRLVPVYPTVDGLYQRTLRRIVKQALDAGVAQVVDFLPEDKTRKQGSDKASSTG